MAKIIATPTTKIYSYFKKLSYRLESAIPEFLDNSIASFRNNEKFFKDKGATKRITIIFDAKADRVIIRDNAFGMTEKELPRAVRLQDVPEDASGLNEFGMGLKTAGFWLGNAITILTKSPNSQIGFKVNMSLEKFNKGESEVPIKPSNQYNQRPWYLTHGTAIMVNGVTKDLTPSTLKKLIGSLGSKYRNDINDLGIEIRIIATQKVGADYYDMVDHYITGKKETTKLAWDKSRKLEWHPPKFWINDANGKPYQEELEFTVTNNDKEYKVTGFVAVKEKGSRAEAGFDLLRRGRVVLEKYRRDELIGGASGFVYQRLFGYFNLDTFPVTQAKDDFDWEDGLEEAFINELKEQEQYKTIKSIADTLRKRSDLKLTDIKTEEFVKSSQIHLSKVADNVETITNRFTLNEMATFSGVEYESTDIAHTLTTSAGEKVIYSKLMENASSEDWIKWEKKSGYENNKDIIIVSLDINHSFFNPFNGDKNFLSIMRLFACCFALAAEENDFDGGSTEDFKEKLGNFLKENVDE